MISRGVERVGLRIDPYRTLPLCASGAAIGTCLAALAPGPVVAALGITVFGSSLAGVYPTSLRIAGYKFRGPSGKIFGILFAIALAGGMIVPWVAGQVAHSPGGVGVYLE
jgi:fucose permease